MAREMMKGRDDVTRIVPELSREQAATRHLARLVRADIGVAEESAEKARLMLKFVQRSCKHDRPNDERSPRICAEDDSYWICRICGARYDERGLM